MAMAVTGMAIAGSTVGVIGSATDLAPCFVENGRRRNFRQAQKKARSGRVRAFFSCFAMTGSRQAYMHQSASPSAMCDRPVRSTATSARPTLMPIKLRLARRA